MSMTTMLRKRTLFGFVLSILLAFPVVPVSAQLTHLNQLVAGGAIASTDTFPLCQTSTGCGPGTALSVGSIGALTTYLGKIFVSKPLTIAALPTTPPHYVASSYTLAATDIGLPVVLHGSSGPVSWAIPVAGTPGFENGNSYFIENVDSNPLTLTLTTGSIFGLCQNPLGQNQWVYLVSDGTNWLASEGGCGLIGKVLAVGP